MQWCNRVLDLHGEVMDSSPDQGELTSCLDLYASMTEQYTAPSLKRGNFRTAARTEL